MRDAGGTAEAQSINIEDARFFLRKLKWGEHFANSLRSNCYSFYFTSLSEAAEYLNKYVRSPATQEERGTERRAFSFADLDLFVQWIRDCVQDTYLANQLEEKMNTEEDFCKKSQIMKQLVCDRFEQLTKVVSSQNLSLEKR